MEMLKFLTQKLKAQSLNEVQPFQPSAEEDRDSGTESDEENAELQALEEVMQEEAENHGSDGAMDSPPHVPLPVCSSTSPLNSLTRRPFQLVSNQSNTEPLTSLSHPYKLEAKRLNPPQQQQHQQVQQESSDFERCSLDYEPTSSAEYENHSSEEELAVINTHQHMQELVAPVPTANNIDMHPPPPPPPQPQREKRKWSQVSQRCTSCSDSSGSSDEEVRDLLSQPPPKPVCFSSSPPKGVHRLNQQTLSPRLFLANVSPATVHLCSVSPRKRHRQTSAVDDSEATVMQRPCLDFDKMQKTTLFRKHVSSHGINKARLVKIKGFTGGSNGRPPKCLYDPSVFAFRSISTAYSPLTPVEEPASCAF